MSLRYRPPTHLVRLGFVEVLDNVNPDLSDSEFIEQDDGLEAQTPEPIPSSELPGHLVEGPTVMTATMTKVRQTGH
jgi:hypothetical protein